MNALQTYFCNAFFLFMKTLKKTIFLVFLFYWLATLVYVMPNNFLRIKLNSVINIMDTFFAQSWNFFAPPPDYDLRLYYIFTSNDNKKYVYESISTILKEKKEKAPFNSTEEYLDYVISGSATSLLDVRSRYYDYFKYKYADSTMIFHSDTTAKTVNQNYKDFSGYLTLMNYSKLVKDRNLKMIKVQSCRFVITGNAIPKFSERYTGKKLEKKFFESKEYQL